MFEVNGLRLRPRKKIISNKTMVKIILFILSYIIIEMKFLKKLLSLEFVVLIIITTLAIAGLLNSQYFSIHDDQHIARLYLLDQAIRQGSLYPRWVDGLGFNFGYPLFNFYPPLIYYVAEFFHLIGFNLLWSLKLMIITGSFFSSIGMYLLGKRFFDKKTGLLAATFFTFFFYRAITIYIRGAWAEFFAMSILPFVFLGLNNIYKNNNFKGALLFSVSLGLLILTHPLIAFPTFFFIGLFFIYSLCPLSILNLIRTKSNTFAILNFAGDFCRLQEYL